MLDTKGPLLLIDLGYALFYRYSATQLWYKHSHPEEKEELTKDYKWHQNEVFVEKMKKMFVDDIMNLAKKHKVPKGNIIIAEDCRLKDNWRSSLFNKYKAQRVEERDKAGWQGGNAFDIIYRDVIPVLVNTHVVYHLKHQNIEADDIISQIVLNNKRKDKSDPHYIPKFIIIASDADYFQILEDNVDLLNMKGVSQKIKMKHSPHGHLVEKIIKGDTSDNIGPCLFSKKWVHHFVPGMPKLVNIDPIIYIKSNKKIMEYYIKNPEQLAKDVAEVKCNSEKDSEKEYIKGYSQNKQLVDFNELPTEYVSDVGKMYAKLF
jgi:hypothetical protein